MTQSLASNAAADSTKNKKIAKDFVQVITKCILLKHHFGNLGENFKCWRKYVLILNNASVFYYFGQWPSNR
jgi:hypothetical protein